MEATLFVIGFIAGCFFTLIFSTLIVDKVCKAMTQVLHKQTETDEDDDDENWWKHGKTQGDY